MTGREFLNSIANGKVDMLELILMVLRDTGTVTA